MALALRPPLAPMLAKLAVELPEHEHTYEPKWDGFRCLVFRDGDSLDLRSRNDRPLARYFPDLLPALAALPADSYVLDGEIVVTAPGGDDFDALLKRIHPAAAHVERLVDEAPASFVGFDALVIGADDLTSEPFLRRRAALEALLTGAQPPVTITPVSEDVEVARRWLDELPVGVDGVVAKHRDLRYEPGRRAMLKVKPRRTADCVVAGCRVVPDDRAVRSLLLGLYDGGVLRHVGVVSAFTAKRRRELLAELAPYVVPLDEHPWAHGFALEGGSMGRLPGSAGRWTPGLPLDWVPLRPELVCEAAYDQVDGRRWRHPGRFLRWRPDRDAASCDITQLDEPRRAPQLHLP